MSTPVPNKPENFSDCVYIFILNYLVEDIKGMKHVPTCLYVQLISNYISRGNSPKFF
jgi:hypothetical protein